MTHESLIRSFGAGEGASTDRDRESIVPVPALPPSRPAAFHGALGKLVSDFGVCNLATFLPNFIHSASSSSALSLSAL